MTITETAIDDVVFAVVAGRPLKQLPPDLIIPPDALEILLDSFTGPLDILLYLIKAQSLDIMDIPIATITLQYMQYIELLEGHRRELAAEYLVMAAWLIEIKSKLLLPATPSLSDELEEDPRLALVKRLQAYERFKIAAQKLDTIPRLERDNFMVYTPHSAEFMEPLPEVTLSCLRKAMMRLLQRETILERHQVTRERLSVQQRITTILVRLQEERLLELAGLLTPKEGRLGLVVTLLAILELERQALVKVTQTTPFARLYIQHNES